MTTEELRDALYEKAYEEQLKFKSWLISQPPEEILNHANKYTISEDILIELGSKNLSSKQCLALLKSPCPLEDIFKEWSKRDGYMDDISDTIECHANEIIREDILKERKSQEVR